MKLGSHSKFKSLKIFVCGGFTLFYTVLVMMYYSWQKKQYSIFINVEKSSEKVPTLCINTLQICLLLEVFIYLTTYVPTFKNTSDSLTHRLFITLPTMF